MRSVTDALLECPWDMAWSETVFRKDMAQESQRDTLKVSPFYFIPEGTPVPDTEEIQDSKKNFINKPIQDINISLGFQESLFQVLLSLGESFWCDLAKVDIRR